MKLIALQSLHVVLKNHKMAKKRSTQTRKRASPTNGVSGENVKYSIETKSQSRVNCMLLCICVFVLCLAFAVFLVWKRPNVDSQANTKYTANQSPKRKDDSKLHRKRELQNDVELADQEGIKKSILD